MKRLEYRIGHFTLELDPEKAHQKYMDLLHTPQQVHRVKLLNKLLDFDVKDKTILDYGCGVGYFSVLFAKRGAKVLGIDASLCAIRSAIWYAKREGIDDRCKFILSSNLSIKNNQKFDLIFLKDIIEHLPENIEFLKQIVNNLSKQGRLIITTPNTWSISYLKDYLYNRAWLKDSTWIGGDDPTHVKLYNPKILKKILSDLNLKIDKWVGGSLIPYDIISWILLLRVKIETSFFQHFDIILGELFPFKYFCYDLYIRCRVGNANK